MDQQRTATPEAPETAGNGGTGVSFAGMLFCFLSTAAAATLIVIAAVIWLGGILGSTALSCLIFGGFAAIVALMIYLISVRRSARILNDYIETVYQTSKIAKAGYERIKSWVDFIIED